MLNRTMLSGRKWAALFGASLLVTGCAGVPTAVSFASMYVNSVLMLRTNKGMADHAVSAALSQDCGFSNLFEHGDYCIDAPAPKLLAALTADADMLTPAHDSVKPAPAIVAATTSAAADADKQSQTQTVLVPPVPASKPAVVAAASAVAASAAEAKASVVEDGYLVVLASYRNPTTATAHQARLKRADSVILTAEVHGEAFHRVAIRADSPGAAQRLLSQVKASGAAGAWVIAAGAAQQRPSSEPETPKPQRPVVATPYYADAGVNPLL